MASNKNKQVDVEALEEARPYLRSAVALAIWLRLGHVEDGFNTAYAIADAFISQLQADVERRT